MEPVTVDQRENILIFNISGELTIPAIEDFIKVYCPMITKDVVYHLRDTVFPSNVNYNSLCGIARLAKSHMTNRASHGKTAHVCTDTLSYGMLNMFSAVLSVYEVPHEQAVFKSVDDAIKWIQTDKQ